MKINPLKTEQIEIKIIEKQLIKSDSNRSLKIGLPKETSNDESRISLTPAGISVLTANGHEVFVEQGAGEEANFSDSAYNEAGADISLTVDDLYKKSELILKVAPPGPDEYEYLRNDHILFSALHIGHVTETFLQAIVENCKAAIGYEFIQGKDNEFPIVRMMHEITGSMAIQIAAHYLEKNKNGRGVMLGGISGIPPSTVVILGAGITAEYAARTALGYGAQVFVMDDDLTRLRHLENTLDRRITTAIANRQYLASALKSADVVIGATSVEGGQAPIWVTETMVSDMKPGSVVVDTVVDQGGCIDTSEVTTHSDPVYSYHDVIHYCVPNIPSKVFRTAPNALTNVLVPYLRSLGDTNGIEECLYRNTALRNGTYAYKNNLTKKSLANMFNRDYRDIEMLIASQI